MHRRRLCGADFFRVDAAYIEETRACFWGLGLWWAVTMLGYPARGILIAHQRYDLLALINASGWVLLVVIIIVLFESGRRSGRGRGSFRGRGVAAADRFHPRRTPDPCALAVGSPSCQPETLRELGASAPPSSADRRPLPLVDRQHPDRSHAGQRRCPLRHPLHDLARACVGSWFCAPLTPAAAS